MNFTVVQAKESRLIVQEDIERRALESKHVGNVGDRIVVVTQMRRISCWPPTPESAMEIIEFVTFDGDVLLIKTKLKDYGMPMIVGDWYTLDCLIVKHSDPTRTVREGRFENIITEIAIPVTTTIRLIAMKHRPAYARPSDSAY